MAIGDAYATVPEYRAWKDIASSDDDLFIESCLDAVSELINIKTNQPYGFNKDATVTTRVYGPGELIAPIASTAGLIIKAYSGYNPTWADVAAITEGSEYELLPRNPRNGWPYTGIKLHTFTSSQVINPATYRSSDYRIQVTAIHGWPEVPKAIKRATLELAAILLQSSIYTTGVVQELDQTIEASPQARGLLKALYMEYNPYPVAVA